MTLFEGREVDGITVKLKSFEVATHDTFHLGAEVYVLTRTTIVAIEHPDKDGSLFRCQVAEPDDGWLVPQLTAARMIDAVEPPKLPGTERVHDKSKDATLDIEVGADGSVKFTDTTTGETHTAPPDDETAASIEERFAQAQAAVAGEPDVADVVDVEAVAETEAILADPETMAALEEAEQDVAEGRVTESPKPKPASMLQRVALTKQIVALKQAPTEDLLAWQREQGIPLNPEHMTFEQARRSLVYLGDIRNAEAE